MVDLDKEREAFIKVYTEIYGEHDQLWQGWKERAELAQEETNKVESMNHHLAEINSDLDRSISIMKAEITDLKQKLARYENPDYVLVPRMPTKEMIRVGENNHSCPEIGSIDEVADIYEAMIEAMEKNDE